MKGSLQTRMMQVNDREIALYFDRVKTLGQLDKSMRFNRPLPRYQPKLYPWSICFLGLVTFLFCTGCRTVQPKSTQTRGHWHTVHLAAATNTPPIRGCDKFNPVWWFGNADRPKPAGSYRPNEHFRKLKWHLRNPLHNFTFYVIGVADKEIVRSGRYPEDTFRPDGGWNIAITRYRWCYLPFVSWCRGTNGFHFYCGWRPKGNFGFKFNFE